MITIKLLPQRQYPVLGTVQGTGGSREKTGKPRYYQAVS